MENSKEIPEAAQPPIEEESKPQKRCQKYWHDRRVRWAMLAVGIIIIIFGIITIISSGSKGTNQIDSLQADTSDSQAVSDGKLLANGQCEGEGVPYKLSEPPMDPEDFSIVVPYGLMVGGHVTPIDHQYFSPISYQSEPDAYEVRAMADSAIVDITTRSRPFGQEYRMVFAVSCTFLYYYDLVTSLTPSIQQAYDQALTSGEPVNIPVEAGQLIGRIGGQTLDFAVWDTTKPLDGFVVSEHYESELWKQYTADPLDYYTAELKEFILTRYVRTTPPISGKIDHDIDGRLIGNWFLEGTNGYAGDGQTTEGAYWTTHLSFSPDHYVPNWFVVSIGDYEVDQNQGPGSQFVSAKNTPNPKDVSVETGLVKYDLTGWSYYDQTAGVWDRNSITTDLSIQVNPSGGTRACAMVQMLETRKLRFEAFKGQNCAEVVDFSAAAKIYTR